MDKKDDGGSAFPLVFGQFGVEAGGQIGSEGGVTVRDYFAAKAMQAHLQTAYSRGISVLYADVSGEAYAAADSMLRERAK